MRLSLILFVALSVTGAHASWFGSEQPQYTTWSKSDLQKWLAEHNIETPSTYSTSQLQALVKSNWDTVYTSGAAWTQDQYNKAQKSFNGVKESTFETWDESRLREFLLEQGVVAPSGPREQLILLAKQKYRSYNAAGTSLANEASKTAGGAMSSASSMAASATSAVVQATKDASRKLEGSRDYVYSSWDEGKMRKYLEDKGIVDKKVAPGLTREQMLEKLRVGYASVADPVWDAWSDSYMREWLISHNLIPDTYDAKRATLAQQMQHYYYNVQDTAYSSWTDSQYRDWAIKNGYLKSDQQIQREKLQKLVADNYASATDTVWGAWSDSDMRSWLIENGYMRSDAQVKRDELVKAINDKYKDASARTAAYLTWPDARLRAYLRERGVSEAALPTSRPGLLQETRIKWIQTQNSSSALYNKVRDLINSSVHSAEDTLTKVLELLSGTADQSKEYASEKASQGKAYADEKVGDARYAAGEKVKKGGEKIKGEL